MYWFLTQQVPTRMSTCQKLAKSTMPTSANSWATKSTSKLSQKRANIHLPSRSEKHRHSSPTIRSWARRRWTSAQFPDAKADSSWLSASNCRVFKFRSRPIQSTTKSGWSGCTPSGFPVPKREARHAATGHEFVSCISQKTVSSRIGNTKSWAKNRGLASDYSLEGKIIKLNKLNLKGWVLVLWQRKVFFKFLKRLIITTIQFLDRLL